MTDNPILKIVADNPALTEALKKEFEKVCVADDLDLRSSDELLGQQFRGYEVAKIAVEEVFREIEKYKTVPEGAPKVNMAR
jgi:hypothetical protein